MYTRVATGPGDHTSPGEEQNKSSSETRQTRTSRQEHDDPYRYRPDIDGLRAVAVLSVILFHMDPALLPAGFVGVDIFFVISGFVVSGSLLRQRRRPSGAATGFSSFSDFLLAFYGRRAKRLAPALFVTVFATALILAVIAGGNQETVGEYYTTCMFGLMGGANVYLAMLPRAAPSMRRVDKSVRASSGPPPTGAEKDAVPWGGGYFDDEESLEEGSSSPLSSGARRGAVSTKTNSPPVVSSPTDAAPAIVPWGGGYFDETDPEQDEGGSNRILGETAEGTSAGTARPSSAAAEDHVAPRGHDFRRNPSLHLWSLGVEEQFYLVFPFVMVLVYGKTRLVGESESLSLCRGNNYRDFVDKLTWE